MAVAEDAAEVVLGGELLFEVRHEFGFGHLRNKLLTAHGAETSSSRVIGKRSGLLFELGGESCDLGGFEGKAVFHLAVEVMLVEGSRVQSRLTPDPLALETVRDEADALQEADADALDGFDLPADARMNEEEIHDEMMAPGADQR